MKNPTNAHIRSTDVVVGKDQGFNARMTMKTAMASANGLSPNMWELNTMLGTGATLNHAHLHALKMQALKFEAFQISIVTN